MSAIDDAGTLVQDIVVPDLKALTALVDALEASIKQRFDSVEKLAESRHELMLLRMGTGFAAVDAKFAAMLAAMEARFAASDAKMAAGFASVDARFAAMDTRFDTLTKTLDTDRRLGLLEAAQAKPAAADQRHA
jgi:hypothetical protein